MKKLLSIALAATMLLSSSAMILAADKSSSTLVKYNVLDSYEVTIPSEIALNGNGYGSGDIVVGENFLIPVGSQLDVYISGHDYTTAWELIDAADNTNRLTYTINDTVVNNDKVLTVEAGHEGNITKKLEFQVTDRIFMSGQYSDTLTFRMTINQNVQENSLLVYNQPYRYDNGEGRFMDYVFQNDGYMTVYNYKSDLSDTGWGARGSYEVVDNKIIMEGDTEFPLIISDDGNRITFTDGGNVEEYVLTPTEVAPVNRQYPFIADFEEVGYSYFIEFYSDGGARLDIRDKFQYNKYDSSQIVYYDTYIDISATGLEWDRIEVHPSGNLIYIDESTIAIETDK